MWNISIGEPKVTILLTVLGSFRVENIRLQSVKSSNMFYFRIKFILIYNLLALQSFRNTVFHSFRSSMLAGTILSGWFGVCWGRNRLAAVETSRTRTMSVLITFGTGLAQLASVWFFLVGWFWSIAWGLVLVSISRQYTDNNKHWKSNH